MKYRYNTFTIRNNYLIDGFSVNNHIFLESGNCMKGFGNMKNISLITTMLGSFSAYILISIVFGCQQSPKSDNPVIARVGQAVLTLNDLNKSIPPEYSNRISRKQRINYVKQWIDTELLYQEALKQKIHKEKEILKRLHQMEKDLLSAEMISRNSSSIHKQKISDDAIIEYYKQHKESFVRESDVVKYIGIVVEDLKTGWKVRNMVTTSNFLELATEYSTVPIQDPNTVSFTPLKNLPAEVANVVFNIRLNGTTSPIKLSDGVHVIRVLDKQNAGEICLVEEVREEIFSTLSAQSQKKDIENLLEELRQKSDYTFNFELLTQNQNRQANDADSLTSDTGRANSGIKEEEVKTQ